MSHAPPGGALMGVTLRPAVPADQRTIRRLVRGAGLDPTALHWSHFIVAERDGVGIVGIGQIRPYRRCPELGSLVVLKAYRGQGLGGAILRALLASRPPPIYLECEGSKVPYYTRFGFREIPWRQAPLPLKLKAGLGNLIARRAGWRVAVMVWDGPPPIPDAPVEKDRPRGG